MIGRVITCCLQIDMGPVWGRLCEPELGKFKSGVQNQCIAGLPFTSHCCTPDTILCCSVTEVHEHTTVVTSKQHNWYTSMILVESVNYNRIVNYRVSVLQQNFDIL